MSDERRKKSWREIDNQRDRSRHTGRRTIDKPMGQKAKRAAKLGYSSYKSSLNKLFNEGVMSEGLKKTLGKNAPNAKIEPGSRMDLLRKLKQAEDFNKFIKLVGQYRKKGFTLPDDYDLLIRLLDHPDDDVQLEALEAIEGCLDRIPCKRTNALRQRLMLLEEIGTFEICEVVERIEDKL